jgi:hypothetical protein
VSSPTLHLIEAVVCGRHIVKSGLICSFLEHWGVIERKKGPKGKIGPMEPIRSGKQLLQSYLTI